MHYKQTVSTPSQQMSTRKCQVRHLVGPVVHKQVQIVLVSSFNSAAGRLYGFHRSRYGPAVFSLISLQACAHEEGEHWQLLQSTRAP